MSKPSNWDTMSKGDQAAFVAKYEVEKGGKPPWLNDKDDENEDKAKKAKDEDDKDAACKAQIAEDDLVKSLDSIEEKILKSETPAARKDALMKKSLAGDASDAEHAELASLLKGETPEGAEPSVSDQVAKSMQPGDEGDLAKSLDVSGALREMFSGVNESLGSIAKALDSGTTHQGEVNMVLAKGLHDTGTLVIRAVGLVKSLEAKLDAVLAQPAGGPRSIGVRPGNIINKSHGGNTPPEDQITKGEVMNLLTEMMVKAQESGDLEKADRYNYACAGVEHTGQADQRTMAEVAAYRRSKMGVAAA